MRLSVLEPLLLFSCLSLVVRGKRLAGSVLLGKYQAKVVTKFCFDYNSDCNKKQCTPEEHPGMLNFVMKAVSQGVSPTTPKTYIALLDDEYFSFPEVSQVWDEANCTDILKASKASYMIDWSAAATTAGYTFQTPLIEKLRPRWWFIAFVSCSPFPLELSYDVHLQNQLKGREREFSMDRIGTESLTIGFCLLFAALLVLQISSLKMWRGTSRSGQWLKQHPALLMLTAAVVLALFGHMSWFWDCWGYQESGEDSDLWMLLGRGGIIASKATVSLLLILLASGECVCTPDIAWSSHRELVAGMVIFALIGLALELWGDSEFRSTTTEYIYDTRPGMMLVAFDFLWMWLYISRSWRTFSQETRIKPRVFYKTYGFSFGLWFTALPMVAFIARLVDAWVRYRIALLVGNISHALCLGLLVHTFRPTVATKIYELQRCEYEPVNDEELDRMLGGNADII